MIQTLFLLNIFFQGAVDPNKFNNFLILGYVVMLIIMLVYVATLASRQRNVRQDLLLLQKLLEEDEKE